MTTHTDTTVDTTELTDTDRAVLHVASMTFRHIGSLERHLRHELNMTARQYLVRLNRLLDDPRALAHDPATVNKHRRLRERGNTLGTAQEEPTHART